MKICAMNCASCLCETFSCLYSASSRCERKCNSQGCSGGLFHPVQECEKYVPYIGQTVKECLKAQISVFQDGYIGCSLIENLGCEKCYKEFEEKVIHNEQ